MHSNQRKLFHFLLIVSVLVSLSGCAIPHRFNMHLTLMKNGDYCLSYSGTFYENDGALRADWIEKDINPRDDRLILEKVDEMIQQLSSDPRIMSLEYIGGGLYQIMLEETGNIHEIERMTIGQSGPDPFSVFSVFKSPDGKGMAFFFSPNTARAEPVRDIGERLLAQMDGTIEIYSELPLDSATYKPEQSGDVRRFIWRFKGWQPESQPLLVVFSFENLTK